MLCLRLAGFFTSHVLGHFKAMYSYMARSRKTFLIFVFITTLFTGCCGTISSIAQTNWTNAHIQCRKEGNMLPNLVVNTLFNETYFWTGHYTRLSGWIKIIGCFEETAVNTLEQISYEMHFPSAGLCQEVCLESNYFVFGLQLKKCVCLEQIPKQRSRGANDCSLSCSIKANLKFKNDCGGNNTYSLFKSGSEKETSAFTQKKCLSIQCPDNAKGFIEGECNASYAQICNKTLSKVYSGWQSSSSECKSRHNSYLLGDVDLTDPAQACKFIEGQPLGHSWLGIAREVYISNERVKNDSEQITRNPSKYARECLKCNSSNCTFVGCNEINYFVCLEMQTTTPTTATGTSTGTTSQGTVSTFTTPTGTATSTHLHGTVFTSTAPTGITKSTTPHGTDFISTTPTHTKTRNSTQHETVFASTTPLSSATRTVSHGIVSTEHAMYEVSEDATGTTNNKKESMMKNQDGNTTVIMVVVPLTVIVVLGLIALLLVILWRRRPTKKVTEKKHAQHETISPNHSERSDPNQSLENNYFVLNKTEIYSVVNSTNSANDKSCRNPHKECSDDDYDHLGENVREEVEEEDSYHHAFFPSNEGESDYGIRNMSDQCLMENPYSHTNTGDHHVTLEDNEYNTISINA
ncbi:uncharacterized protein LOC128160652 isoform X3 [Crassostrea angulata]|uniref:uncharacterized protein LOC128160652 isoform X3 n=1 Tax=Magallana angulata TaxID=2784310 RepID=UPI0022B0CE2C|nr:uncharacterized protein LOC128160652 isoform X3 [Crassostrea angulata]